MSRLEFNGAENGLILAVYLAGPWPRRTDYIKIAEELEATGMYVVTSRWLHIAVSPQWSSTDPYFRGYSRWKAAMDLGDVGISDLCIFDLIGANVDTFKRMGTHTELGAALAYGKPCWLVGDRCHVFHYALGTTYFETMEAAVDELLGRKEDDL